MSIKKLILCDEGKGQHYWCQEQTDNWCGICNIISILVRLVSEPDEKSAHIQAGGKYVYIVEIERKPRTKKDKKGNEVEAERFRFCIRS